MSILAPIKNSVLSSLREVGSEVFLVRYLRYRTCKAKLISEINNDAPDKLYIHSTLQMLFERAESLKVEFNNVLDTYNQVQARRYFKNIAGDLLKPLEASREVALSIATKHNNIALMVFAAKISENELKFFEHPERKYKHLEKFERVTPAWFSPWTRTVVAEKKEEEVNKNFFTVDIEPDILDTTYIDDYFSILNAIKEQLINELWDEIEYCQNEVNLLQNKKQDKVSILGDKQSTLPDRIQINLTTDQIAELADERKSVNKPTFKPELIEQIFILLKDYFDLRVQAQLRELLECGGSSKQPLVFKANGNRLADAFKQLFMYQIITGCSKTNLESWVKRSFKYMYRGEEKHYSDKYLNDIISTDTKICKNPILTIVDENGDFKIQPLKQSVRKSDSF